MPTEEQKTPESSSFRNVMKGEVLKTRIYRFVNETGTHAFSASTPKVRLHSPPRRSTNAKSTMKGLGAE